MEGLSLGLVHSRPPLVGCVRRIALTCGFASPVQSRTRFPTATDQKVRGSSPFGRAWSEVTWALGPPFWVSMGLNFPVACQQTGSCGWLVRAVGARGLGPYVVVGVV
jgi:hypothetical protein